MRSAGLRKGLRPDVFFVRTFCPEQENERGSPIFLIREDFSNIYCIMEEYF